MTTVRTPLVRVGGKIIDLPNGDVIAAAPSGPMGATGATGATGPTGATGATGAGGGALVLLEKHTASSSTSLDFTTAITSTYDDYLIEILGLIPATSAVQAMLRFSTNGGVSFDSGANYRMTDFRVGPAGSAGGGGTGFTAINITGGGASSGSAGVEKLSATSTSGYSATFRLFYPGSGSLWKRMQGQTSFESTVTTGIIVIGFISGAYMSTSAVNAFSILMSSGNIASGAVRCYGIANT